MATSNVKQNAFGSLKVTYGDWTGSEGDANQTFVVSGGRVYLCEWTDQDSTAGPNTIPCPWFVSTTGTSTVTVSIANRNTVTNGRFIIVHA